MFSDFLSIEFQSFPSLPVFIASLVVLLTFYLFPEILSNSFEWFEISFVCSFKFFNFQLNFVLLKTLLALAILIPKVLAFRLPFRFGFLSDGQSTSLLIISKLARFATHVKKINKLLLTSYKPLFYSCQHRKIEQNLVFEPYLQYCAQQALSYSQSIY